MAKSSDLTPYRPTTISWSALKAIDADKPPMPNAGMQAIAAICGQASAMGANFHAAGLGNIVAGNNAVLMPPAHQISGMNGAALAGLALGGGALALSLSGKGKNAESTESKKGPPAPPTEVPAAKSSTSGTEAPATTAANPTDATPTKKPGLSGPGTISLSDDAAKKLKGASWVGVGSKPGDSNPESGEKVPTSIKVTPVKDGETAKKGFEMIEYDGNKYWVSTKDQGTYASWNKAFGTNFGGLKADDSISKEDPTPKPAVVTPTATATTAPLPVPQPQPTPNPGVVVTPSGNGEIYTPTSTGSKMGPPL